MQLLLKKQISNSLMTVLDFNTSLYIFSDGISMQACESYAVHKTKDITRGSLYENPNINIYDDDAIYET